MTVTPLKSYPVIQNRCKSYA